MLAGGALHGDRAGLTGARARLVAEHGGSGDRPRAGAETLRSLVTPHTGRRGVAEAETTPETTAGPVAVGLSLGDTGPEVANLQRRLVELGYYPPGLVDGQFESETLASLREFQDDQLALLDDAIDRVADAPPHRVELLASLRADAFEERVLGEVGTLTADLFGMPLDDASVDAYVTNALAPPTNEEALAYFTSMGDDTTPGLVEVGALGALARYPDADKLREVMRWMDDVDGRADAREVLDLMSPENFRSLGRGLDKLDAGEIDTFVDDLAPWLKPEELLEVFGEASDATRQKLVDAVRHRGDPDLQTRFASAAERSVLENETALGRGLSRADRELVLDLGQLLLDIAGIVDPTPASDGTNAVISLLRGDWFGAGASAISILPYFGDLAKLGKLGNWARTVERVIAKASTDSAFAQRVRPILERIQDAIGSIPDAFMNRLSPSAREHLDDIYRRIDTLRTGRIGTTVGRLGDNRVEWTTDASGRPLRAEATLTEIHHAPRTPDETRNQRNAGGADRRSDDHGGHLIGHRFMGDEGGLANLFPQNANFNTGAYKTFENEVADWIRAGAEVRIDVKLTYDGPGARPSTVQVEFTVHHPTTGEILHDGIPRFRNEGGQTFNNRSTADFIAEKTRSIGTR